MKGPEIASPCEKMRTRSKIPALVVSAFAASLLGGCSTLGTPTVSGKDEEALYTPAQSNLASLSEVDRALQLKSLPSKYANLNRADEGENGGKDVQIPRVLD